LGWRHSNLTGWILRVLEFARLVLTKIIVNGTMPTED